MLIDWPAFGAAPCNRLDSSRCSPPAITSVGVREVDSTTIAGGPALQSDRRPRPDAVGESSLALIRRYGCARGQLQNLRDTRVRGAVPPLPDSPHRLLGIRRINRSEQHGSALLEAPPRSARGRLETQPRTRQPRTKGLTLIISRVGRGRVGDFGPPACRPSPTTSRPLRATRSVRSAS